MGFRWGNLIKRNHLEDLDGRITLQQNFKKWDGKHGLDSSGSGKGHVADTCECGNEPSGSIKCKALLD